MQKVTEQFTAHLLKDKSAAARRVYTHVYNKGILCGVFADGMGNGYVERLAAWPIPRYAYAYIMRFIKQWRPAK